MSARRRIAWSAAVVMVTWILTGIAGVPAVVEGLPNLEARSTGSVADVHVHSAFAVCPFVVLVRYESSVGGRRLPEVRRAVLWWGAGACFLGVVS